MSHRIQLALPAMTSKLKWTPRDSRAAIAALGKLSMDERATLPYLIDLIYLTGDRLEDDDKEVAHHLRLHMRRWKKVKESLLSGGWITIEDGFIRNQNASETYAQCALKYEAKASRSQSDTQNLEPVSNENGDLATTDTDSDLESESDLDLHLQCEAQKKEYTTLSEEESVTSDEHSSPCKKNLAIPKDQTKLLESHTPRGESVSADETCNPPSRPPRPRDVLRRIRDMLVQQGCTASKLDRLTEAPIRRWLDEGIAEDCILNAIETATLAKRRAVANWHPNGLAYFENPVRNEHERQTMGRTVQGGRLVGEAAKHACRIAGIFLNAGVDLPEDYQYFTAEEATRQAKRMRSKVPKLRVVR